MTHKPGGYGETGGKARALSRRAALLLVLAGSLTSIGPPLPLRKGRPSDDIVLVDGWILRLDDLEGTLRGAG
jgi:hypothetical protein